MIAFFAGSACSRDSKTVEISSNQPIEEVYTSADRPPLEGETESQEGTETDKTAVNSSSSDVVDESTVMEQAAEEFQASIQLIQNQNQTQVEEILGLYRRLHIELDDSGRSDLIVDLFNDSRVEIRELGFELTDRDLSSNTVLLAEVSEAAIGMLDDASPEIRSKAARLITRLVPPDAMIVLTESLAHETDALAAEPMLMGIARWPSPEAVDPVLMWFLRTDAPFASACSAAWSIEQAGYWETQQHHPQLLNRLRSANPQSLHEEGMKLIARFGDASDLRVLLSLLLEEDQNQQQWAANALVETPRAVEMLVQAAEENDRLFKAACDSLIRHRATPEGLRRLVSLPYPEEGVRIDAIVRMGAALESDRLAEAVRLADLDSTQTVLLLNRLLNGNIEITARVAKGIIQLAQIELDALRPNRAFEATIALDDASLDPAERSKIDTIKAISLILLGKMDEALAVNTDAELWFATIQRTTDIELRKRIAGFMIESFGESLSANRIEEIRTAGGLIEANKEVIVDEPTDSN